VNELRNILSTILSNEAKAQQQKEGKAVTGGFLRLFVSFGCCVVLRDSNLLVLTNSSPLFGYGFAVDLKLKELEKPELNIYLDSDTFLHWMLQVRLLGTWSANRGYAKSSERRCS
jgi:hypothetical protein